MYVFVFSIVLAGRVASPPFIAKNASPIPGRNVTAVPTPKPIASPFLLSPSMVNGDEFNIIRCPSIAVVDRQDNVRVPARPHPLAFFLSICTSTGVPAFISTFPLSDFTSASTMTSAFCVLVLLLISVVVRTCTYLPRGSGVLAKIFAFNNAQDKNKIILVFFIA